MVCLLTICQLRALSQNRILYKLMYINEMVLQPWPWHWFRYQTWYPDTTIFFFHINRVNVQFSTKYHWVREPITTEWTHFVVNYLDYHSDEAVQIYYDGEKWTGDSVPTVRTATPSDRRRIVIGRKYDDVDGEYSTMEINELALYNTVLSSEQISDLYDSYE